MTKQTIKIQACRRKHAMIIKTMFHRDTCSNLLCWV